MTRRNGSGGPAAKNPRIQGAGARSPARLTRRRFAALAAAVAAAGGAPASGRAEVDAFRRLSATLTGFPATSLDIRFARNLLQALRCSGHQAAVGALTRGEEVAGRASLEADIVSAWYSGLLPGAAGPTVAAVREALVWRALGFATPPGTCTTGGPWDRPPSGEHR